MSDHSRQSGLSEETGALLSALVLGEASDAQLNRLNDLLESDVELRRQAARFLEEEAVLRHQFQILGRVGDYHSPPAGLSPVEIAAAKKDAPARPRLFPGGPLFLAASLLAALTIGVIWNSRQFDREEAAQFVIEDEGRMPAPSELNGDPGAARGMAGLPRVTKVSWSGPHFDSHVEDNGLATAVKTGVVPFISAGGRPAEGYMVHLPPGASLELVVTSHAWAENAMSVTEFDSFGRPSGRRMTYSNNMADETAGTASAGVDSDDPQVSQFGRLGVWSEHNNGPFPRYYLLTCVHKLLDQSSDDAWRVSPLTPLLVESNIAHIGWDDSGTNSERDSEGKLVQSPDADFDDLSATIRVWDRDDASNLGSPDVRISAGGDGSKIAADVAVVPGEPSEPGFSFSVEPGEVVVVKAFCRVRTHTEIALVEKRTGRVRWSSNLQEPSSPKEGICAIENRTHQSQEFVLTGRRRIPEANDARWGIKHSVLFEEGGFRTVQFDGGDDDADVDEVDVNMLTMGAL